MECVEHNLYVNSKYHSLSDNECLLFKRNQSESKGIKKLSENASSCVKKESLNELRAKEAER